MIEEVIDSLSELLDDDLHYSHTKGGVDSKAQFLSSVESKRTDYLAAKRRDVEVRLFGNSSKKTFQLRHSISLYMNQVVS